MVSFLGAVLPLLALTHAMPLESTTVLSTEVVPRDGTGSVSTSAGLAWYQSNNATGTNGVSPASTYKCFTGPSSNFPPISQWINFKAMWALQKQAALIPIGDSTTEINNILTAIQKISALAKVDARVILAVIIDESTGNVRVKCTPSYGGVQNCGLMQSYNATDKTYDPNNSLKSITQMVIDGTQGTPSGPGLVQWFNSAPDVSFNTGGNLYKALRGYNSGAINLDNLSDGKGATNAYVSNVANFLLGWNGSGNGPSTCTFVPKTTTTSAPTPTKTVSPASCSSAKYVPAPTQTVSGTTKDCCKWYTTKSGDNCYNIDQANGITLNQFRSWNTYIDASCDNLFVGYAYCVSSNDKVTVS